MSQVQGFGCPKRSTRKKNGHFRFSNGLNGMHHLGFIQLHLVFIIFIVLYDMDESSSRFRMPKTFDEEKKWAFQIFQQRKDQRTLKICTIEPGGLFKGEGIGVDMQELTESIENLNAKSLNYWLLKFVQEVANKLGGRYPSRTLYSIVCELR